MIEQLKKMNPQLDFYHIGDVAFKPFGRVLDVTLFDDALHYLDKHTEVPLEGNRYIAHDPDMDNAMLDKTAIHQIFGHLPIQYGYVNGKNSLMNAMEYHKSAEVNVALTPLVLLLAHVSDVHDNHFHSKDVKAFYVPQKTAFECYPLTLHFSPCKVIDTGFKCAVILPFGTNTADTLPNQRFGAEDDLLFKTNKWLLAHPEAKHLIEKGAYPGIVGDNIEIRF